jgi:hypothetical protein
MTYVSTLKVEAICSFKNCVVFELHGIATQNTALFVVNAVRTSNPNKRILSI